MNDRREANAECLAQYRAKPHHYTKPSLVATITAYSTVAKALFVNVKDVDGTARIGLQEGMSCTWNCRDDIARVGDHTYIAHPVDTTRRARFPMSRHVSPKARTIVRSKPYAITPFSNQCA